MAERGKLSDTWDLQFRLEISIAKQICTTSMVSQHDDISGPGPIASLLPAFEFEGLIGRGATGAVYKARQRSLDRAVAIRTICRDRGGDPGFRSSFKDRARAMARLSHPNLIRIFDFGELEGLPYLVMEYVPGKSLSHSARGKAIDPRQAVEIVIAACEGLAHAHAHGIAHGAIQPADILLTPKCEPKIGNFGCSGHAAGADASAYMAPELAARNVSAGPSADVHAIGMILRELLTGVPAGAADAMRVSVADPRLAAICRQACHPDPTQRFSDAASLALALKSWLNAPRALVMAPAKPQVPPHQPGPVLVKRPGPGANRILLRNCAVIGVLLFAIHGAFGIYQEKQRTVARLREIGDAKPRVIIVKKAGGDQHLRIDPTIAQARP